MKRASGFLFLITLPLLAGLCSCHATRHTVYLSLTSSYRLSAEHLTSTKPAEYTADTLKEWEECSDKWFDNSKNTLISPVKDATGEILPESLTFRITEAGQNAADAITYDCSYYITTYVARQGVQYSHSGSGYLTLGDGNVLPVTLYSRTTLFIDLPEGFLGTEGEARTLQMTIC